MSALATIFYVGDVVTPRVPMRRPLVSALCAITGRVREGDFVGTLHAVPGLKLEIVLLIDRDDYALCSCPDSEAVALIKLSDLEPHLP